MSDTEGFTHVLVSDEPFFKSKPESSSTPDGTWPAGSRVIIITDAGGYSRIASEQGTVGFLKSDALQPLR